MAYPSMGWADFHLGQYRETLNIKFRVEQRRNFRNVFTKLQSEFAASSNYLCYRKFLYYGNVKQNRLRKQIYIFSYDLISYNPLDYFQFNEAVQRERGWKKEKKRERTYWKEKIFRWKIFLLEKSSGIKSRFPVRINVLFKIGSFLCILQRITTNESPIANICSKYYDGLCNG